ncbi:MAG: topoisomerase, partial [Chloroflexota bacterium]
MKVVELPGLPEHGDVSDWLDVGHVYEELRTVVERAEAWRPVPAADGGELLREIENFIRRFVVMTNAQAALVSLWVIHTHAFDAADVTPYLAITSAEKESGKTQLLETLELLVADPWFTARVTAAVLVRKIDAEGPTLLLDESDAAFGADKEYAAALRSVLNSGYRRGGKASCCVGQGASISYKDFSTFCPKAIAGINKLP